MRKYDKDKAEGIISNTVNCRLRSDLCGEPMCYDVIARLKEALPDRKGGRERWRTAGIVLKRFRMFTRAFH